MSATNGNSGAKPCDCRDGDECYGDYLPKGIKCRGLEPMDLDALGPDMPDLSDEDLDEMDRRCGST